MTVYIEKPAVTLREELASLRNQGGYQEQQFYFDGLVTNGTFDADTDWTKGTGWTINSGVATYDGVTNLEYIQDGGSISLEAGKVYLLEWEITAVSGGSNAVVGFFDGATSLNLLGSYQINAVGVYSATFTMPSTKTGFRVYGNNTSGTGFSIDNVSVFEVDANDDVIHTMPKGWVPKDVFEDGLLQREGAAHDYEVVYDGFDYVIKPTVAPSATTQTCVIGVKA